MCVCVCDMARCIQTCMAQPLQSWPESTIRCRVRTLSPGYPSRAWDTHHLLRRSRCCCCCRGSSHPLCAAPVPAQTPATVTVITEVTPTKKYRVYVEYRECSEHAVLGYLPSGVGIKLVCWLVGVTTVITLTAEEAGTETETALRLLLLLLLLLPHRRDAEMNVSWYGMNPGSPERACGCQTAKPSAPVRISRALHAQMLPAAAFRARSRSGDASEMSCITVNVSVNVSVCDMACRGRRRSPSRCNKPRLRRLRPPEPTPIGSGRAAAAAAARCCCRYFSRRP